MDAMTIIVVGLIALIAVTGAVSVMKPDSKKTPYLHANFHSQSSDKYY